jgi:uncharacterized membrane protein
VAIQLFIVALSFAGLLISLYFTFAYYGRIKKASWVPEILCAREGSSCVTVLQTPYARVFGVPNSLLGIVYYLLIIAVAAHGLETPLHGVHYVVPPIHIVFLPSLATVLLGFYLVYALWQKLAIHCALCYATHALNLVLFVLLMAAAR